MRIVFLDFDGVLNSLPWLGARAGEGWQGAGEACAGSGSTGEAAEAEGRRFLGWDHDPRFGMKGH